MRGRKAQSNVAGKRSETRRWRQPGIRDYQSRELHPSPSQSRGPSPWVREFFALFVKLVPGRLQWKLLKLRVSLGYTETVSTSGLVPIDPDPCPGVTLPLPTPAKYNWGLANWQYAWGRDGLTCDWTSKIRLFFSNPTRDQIVINYTNQRFETRKNFEFFVPQTETIIFTFLRILIVFSKYQQVQRNLQYGDPSVVKAD